MYMRMATWINKRSFRLGRESHRYDESNICSRWQLGCQLPLAVLKRREFDSG